jgi:hypothetical protein
MIELCVLTLRKIRNTPRMTMSRVFKMNMTKKENLVLVDGCILGEEEIVQEAQLYLDDPECSFAILL